MESKNKIIQILHREEVLFAQEICINEGKRALSDFADNSLFIHFNEYLSIPKQYVILPYIHESCLKGYEVTTLKGVHELDDLWVFSLSFYKRCLLYKN